jgi:hypothetical protein
MGHAGEFPEIRAFVKPKCKVCALPEDVVAYMNQNSDVTDYGAWSRWLREVGHDLGNDGIRRHFINGHAS